MSDVDSKEPGAVLRPGSPSLSFLMHSQLIANSLLLAGVVIYLMEEDPMKRQSILPKLMDEARSLLDMNQRLIDRDYEL